MQKVTLKEFALLAKDNDELKDLIPEIIKNKDSAPGAFAELARNYGYEITDDLQSSSKDVEELDDDALLAVTGGESFIERSELCAFIMGLFGFDIEDCY